jgi:signal transduction histidine kinase
MHGRVEEFRLDLRAANGRSQTVLAYANLRSDSDPLLIDISLVPIYERRRLEDELIRIKQAAELAPGMLFQETFSSDGHSAMPYATNAIRQLYGLTPQQVREDDAALFNRVHPEDQDRLLSSRQNALRSGPLWQCRYRVCLPDGRIQWHEVYASARQMADGAMQLHGVITDVTAHEVLQLALRDKDAAEAASLAKSDFLARISHEFRTPLNGIIGFAQLLTLSNTLPPPQLHQLMLIEQRGKTLLLLANNLLDIARIESGTLELQYRPVSLRAQLAAVMASLKTEATTAGIRLGLREGADLRLITDPNRLRQILSNLVSNAIKYNQRDGEVEIVCSRDAQNVRIAVHDTGIGIDESQLPFLFQPFQRLSAERAETEGTGLGLMLCKYLAEIMGGRIEVDSELSVGSTFSLVLPLPPSLMSFSDEKI